MANVDFSGCSVDANGSRVLDETTSLPQVAAISQSSYEGSAVVTNYRRGGNYDTLLEDLNNATVDFSNFDAAIATKTNIQDVIYHTAIDPDNFGDKTEVIKPVIDSTTGKQALDEDGNVVNPTDPKTVWTIATKDEVTEALNTRDANGKLVSMKTVYKPEQLKDLESTIGENIVALYMHGEYTYLKKTASANAEEETNAEEEASEGE